MYCEDTTEVLQHLCHHIHMFYVFDSFSDCEFEYMVTIL